MSISTLPANTPRAVFEQWRQYFWSAVLRHDYAALSGGLSVDYILVLLDDRLATNSHLTGTEQWAWS